MNKLAMLLRSLHQTESNVEQKLLALGKSHAADHDIYHLSQDLADWSRRHAEQIAEIADDYNAHLDAGAPSPFATSGPVASKPRDLQSEPGLALLWDLRMLHLDLIGLSVDWELLGQTAQARKDDRLLTLARRCHPDTLRQARWANAKIKESSPQIMAVSDSPFGG